MGSRKQESDRERADQSGQQGGEGGKKGAQKDKEKSGQHDQDKGSRQRDQK